MTEDTTSSERGACVPARFVFVVMLLSVNREALLVRATAVRNRTNLVRELLRKPEHERDALAHDAVAAAAAAVGLVAAVEQQLHVAEVALAQQLQEAQHLDREPRSALRRRVVAAPGCEASDAAVDICPRDAAAVAAAVARDGVARLERREPIAALAVAVVRLHAAATVARRVDGHAVGVGGGGAVARVRVVGPHARLEEALDHREHRRVLPQALVERVLHRHVAALEQSSAGAGTRERPVTHGCSGGGTDTRASIPRPAARRARSPSRGTGERRRAPRRRQSRSPRRRDPSEKKGL